MKKKDYIFAVLLILGISVLINVLFFHSLFFQENRVYFLGLIYIFLPVFDNEYPKEVQIATKYSSIALIGGFLAYSIVAQITNSETDLDSLFLLWVGLFFFLISFIIVVFVNRLRNYKVTIVLNDIKSIIAALFALLLLA